MAARWALSDTPDLDLAAYNAWDVVATARLHRALVEELRETGQLAFYERRVWPLVPVVLAIQRRGLRLDEPRLREKRDRLIAERDACEATIRAIDPEINLQSPHQRAALLFDKLGLKPGRRTETGLPSTDQQALLTLWRNLRKRDEHARPVLEALLHRSRIATILSRYLSLTPGPDGRVRPRVKMARAETGRLAYADPPLQQYPPEVRDIFVPEPGHVFVAADFKQLELRILAYLARDERAIRVFESGADPHAETAKTLLGLSDAEWEALPPDKRKAARNLAKAFGYGIAYGGNPAHLKSKVLCPCPRCGVPESLQLSREQMREAAARWERAHPRIVAWREELLREVRRRGNLYVNPYGRKRWFFTPWPALRTEVLNYPMQSTAADLVNESMVELHQLGAPIVLQMHDSIMLEVPEREAERWAAVLREVMERPRPELGGARFPVDVEVKERWG